MTGKRRSKKPWRKADSGVFWGLLTDLVQIRALAAAHDAENVAFRRHLSVHHPPPHLLHDIGARVQREINCTACANCCRQTRVEVRPEEVEDIASHLQSRLPDVLHEYIEDDPAEHKLLLRHAAGECVFLDENLCMIYEARPRPCREFPHLTLDHESLGSRLSSVCRNAWLCPIVFNTLEQFKHELGFPRSH
ncbi:MAG: YkgJ family cysteine cluster protein [Acidobacteria bacterium]|nr:YkgJ family cysteine cluster protein [Acidobacteriota bacterium]